MRIGPPLWTDSLPLWKQQTFVRLVVALLLGMCIGAERQWRQRAAGLRTNTLVCLGAAAFVDLGLTIAPNTTQVIAYVVSGVGFLGAGAIMKDGASVRGLNTAATLWCSAAVGACVGAGELLDGCFVSLLLVGINSALRPLSRYIDQRSLATTTPYRLFRVRIICESDHVADTELQLTHTLADHSLLMQELRVETTDVAGRSVLQGVVEAQHRSDERVQEVAKTLRGYSWIDSVEIAGTDPDAE